MARSALKRGPGLRLDLKPGERVPNLKSFFVNPPRREEKPMLNRYNKVFHIVAGVLALGALAAGSPALAQTTPPPQSVAPSSVLPTGGGAALLDASDTAILLLDHQSGLFQTV